MFQKAFKLRKARVCKVRQQKTNRIADCMPVARKNLGFEPFKKLKPQCPGLRSRYRYLTMKSFLAEKKSLGKINMK